jgi:hypothetical protein
MTYADENHTYMNRELRQKYNHPKLQKRPLVYYCYMEPEVVTNTAFSLAVYLMLEHGFTPEQAAQPFICIHPSPLIGFRDATWCNPPIYTLDIVSCLRGFRKGVEACLTGHVLKQLVEDFDCETYDRLGEPFVLNMNQVRNWNDRFRQIQTEGSMQTISA